MPLNKLTRLRNGGPLALTLPAGIRLVDERTLKPFANYRNERMMDYTLLHWRGGDGAHLRIAYLEKVVVAKTECSACKFLVERIEVFF